MLTVEGVVDMTLMLVGADGAWESWRLPFAAPPADPTIKEATTKATEVAANSACLLAADTAIRWSAD